MNIFSRTHADIDALKDARENPESFSQQSWSQTQRTLRKYCNKYLTQYDRPKVDIFMVSNLDSTRISDDFGREFLVIEFPDNQRLKTNILESLPILQKTALLFSMGPESKELIRLKVQELEQRIWKLAILSAVAGTIR